MAGKHTVQEVWDEVQIIKLNHLEHLRSDIEHIKSDVDKVDKKVDKMDQRLWAIIIILLTGIILPAIITLVK